VGVNLVHWVQKVVLNTFGSLQNFRNSYRFRDIRLFLKICIQIFEISYFCLVQWVQKVIPNIFGSLQNFCNFNRFRDIRLFSEICNKIYEIRYIRHYWVLSGCKPSSLGAESHSEHFGSFAKFP